jgi:hypothetical protein
MIRQGDAAATGFPTTVSNLSSSYNTGGVYSGGTNVAAPVSPISPAAPAAAGYNGLSSDQYRESLIASVRAGVMTEYEANANVIRNNLAQAMASMDAELAALEPLYQGQLQTIASNQFSTQEITKERMNQGGWNASNSGLAIGEQTRIGNAADKGRADASLSKTQSEAGINRNRNLTQQVSNNDLATAESTKNQKLAGAEAEALIQSDTRNRSMYESDRTYNAQQQQSDRTYSQQQQQFAESIRQFNAQLNESMANRTASQKATDAKDTSSFTETQLDDMASSTVSWINTQPDINKAINDMLKDTDLPASVKKAALALLQDKKTFDGKASLFTE